MTFPQYDTIAIVGRAPSSRHRIPEIKPDTAVFVFAATADIKEVPHITAALEIHPLELLSHPKYSPWVWAWCQEEHDFPVYMMDAFEACPSSVRYPRELVYERFGNVLRDDDPLRYFSSSFDWLMALALLHEPKRIEIYGVNMGSDTEYRYQREGAAFWMGVAAGLGVEVWLPEECSMLDSRLYGYEGAQAITFDRLEEMEALAQGWLTDAEAEYTSLADSIPQHQNGSADLEGMVRELGKIRDDVYVKSGGLQAIRQLKERFSVGDIISRQELETQRSATQLNYEYMQARLNFWEGIVKDRRGRLEFWKDTKFASDFTQEVESATEQAVKARDDFFVWQGARKLLMQLIKETDLQRDDEWRLTPQLLTVEANSTGITEGAKG